MEDNVKTSALSQSDMLEKFVDQLIDEKKMPKTDRLRAELSEKVSDAVMTEILMNLPDYLLDKINAAYDENRASDELIEEIINESGVDTKQIAEKTLLSFREQFLA